jgi:hypothetical protein
MTKPMKLCPGTRRRGAHTLPADSDHFTRNKARSDGLAVYCKTCSAERQRDWKIANPEKVRVAKRVYLARKRAEKSRGAAHG